MYYRNFCKNSHNEKSFKMDSLGPLRKFFSFILVLYFNKVGAKGKLLTLEKRNIFEFLEHWILPWHCRLVSGCPRVCVEIWSDPFHGHPPTKPGGKSTITCNHYSQTTPNNKYLFCPLFTVAQWIPNILDFDPKKQKFRVFFFCRNFCLLRHIDDKLSNKKPHH